MSTISRFSIILITLLLVIPAAVTGQTVDTGAGTSTRQPIAEPTEKTKNSIFNLINSVRHDNERPLIKSDPVLDDLALRRSKEMASAHARDLAPFQGRFESILSANNELEFYGESSVRILQGIEADGKVLQYMLKRPRYRRNIMNRAVNLAGVGVHMGSAGEVYVTTIFVASTTDTLEAPAEEDELLLSPAIPDLQGSIQLGPDSSNP